MTKKVMKPQNGGLDKNNPRQADKTVEKKVSQETKKEAK